MVRVVVVGVGPIGLACAKAIRAERDLQLVGLVDVDPQKQGKTIDQLGRPPAGAGNGGNAGDAGPRVVNTIAAALSASGGKNLGSGISDLGSGGGASGGGGADVAVLTTSSQLEVIAPTLGELLDHKLAVVSSCERLAWPWYRYPELALSLDERAMQAGRAILGTGVNPGFVMDALAVTLACMARRVTAVRCERRVEGALRRQPLQAKIGATMTVARFNELKAAGKIGHEGLPESVAMIAAGLGRTAAPGSVEVVLEPVVAEKPVSSALGLIQPGMVAGIHNTAQWSGDGLSIQLDLTMAVGLADPRDTVTLEGPVQLQLRIPGGIPGDSATVAALLNHIRVVHEAKPGLRTMLDIPPAGCRGRGGG